MDLEDYLVISSIAEERNGYGSVTEETECKAFETANNISSSLFERDDYEDTSFAEAWFIVRCTLTYGDSSSKEFLLRCDNDSPEDSRYLLTEPEEIQTYTRQCEEYRTMD